MPEHPTAARGRPILTESKMAERRKEIAAIALHLYINEGFASVSMRRLGKEVGLTPMALYRYYPSKLDILAELWSYLIGKAFEQVTVNTNNYSDPKDVLQEAAHSYVRYWCENTEHYHLVFMASGVSNSQVKSFVGNHEAISHYDIFFNVVANIRSEDRYSLSVKRATDGLICHLHGITHSLITMQGYPWTNAKQLVVDAVRRIEEI